MVGERCTNCFHYPEQHGLSEDEIRFFLIARGRCRGRRIRAVNAWVHPAPDITMILQMAPDPSEPCTCDCYVSPLAANLPQEG